MYHKNHNCFNDKNNLERNPHFWLVCGLAIRGFAIRGTFMERKYREKRGPSVYRKSSDTKSFIIFLNDIRSDKTSTKLYTLITL